MVKGEKILEGYRATEAGILPIDWQVKRLSEVATELTERAGQDKYETVSISAGIGFVNQAEKFGKELSGNCYPEVGRPGNARARDPMGKGRLVPLPESACLSLCLL